MTALTIRGIQRAACEVYGLTMEDLVGRSRARALSWPRQRAITAATLATGASLPKVGMGFGGRDHTTIMHAVKAVKRRREGWEVVAILELAATYLPPVAERERKDGDCPLDRLAERLRVALVVTPGAEDTPKAGARGAGLDALTDSLSRQNQALRARIRELEAITAPSRVRMDRAYGVSKLRRELADAREENRWLEEQLDEHVPGWRYPSRRGVA